jgi:hypothetical protein
LEHIRLRGRGLKQIFELLTTMIIETHGKC